jgi:hypothetical protein
MQTPEVIFIVVVFGIIFWLTDPSKKGQQPAPDKQRGIAYEQKLHQLRLDGIDEDKMYEMAGELIRRGVSLDKVPKIEGTDRAALYDLQTRLELMLNETPYVPRDISEPTEDRTLAKSSWQVWPRPLEQQNGDN